MQMTAEDARELFRRHNLRCTRQRELILLALANTKDHPTADELYRSVKARDTGISLATIYNTLDALVTCGVARRAPSGSGPARFDADMRSHAHILTHDGAVVDVPEDLSAKLLAAVPGDVLRELESRLDISVSRLSLQVVAGPGARRAAAVLRDKVAGSA
jgi:Fur family peroxide stress response transcriptional regulator